MARRVWQTYRRSPRLTKGASRENNPEKNPRDVNGDNAQVKIVRETLKAKGYDLKQVETGRAEIDET